MPTKHLIDVDGRELAVSNLEKVYFPGNGFTKGEVIEFYSSIADVLLPHLKDRPLTLKRYPEGVTGEHFYEKNAPRHTPDWIARFAVPRSEGDGEIKYILCNDRPTLLWATNLGDIEKHVLLAQAPNLNCPTAIVFDLDPGEPAGMIECCRVALHLRDLLASWNLESFAKVSGSKGLHLSVPLNSATPYEQAQPFAKVVAELAAQRMPGEVVSEMAKTLRRGKVLIDWSQNSDFKTTVCVYSMRAKRGEPFISMPVTWTEVENAVKKKTKEALFFTPAAALKRIKKLGDLFAPVLTVRQELPSVFTEALAASPPPKLHAWPRNRSKTRDTTLQEYADKRDHTRTPEPAAKLGKHEAGKRGVHRFVIQKHAASHLHYDWRLEMQGVLRSWAVPKGPPMELRKAHLAMHVEDHPLEYADFEGTIPPGNYGAGTVMVWDQGEYEDLTGNPTAAFYAGKMHVTMRGKKLRGEWILVKDRREGEESNKWLLIKAGASQTLSEKADDRSAVSGRSMREIAEANDTQWQSNRKAASTKAAGKSAKAKGAKPRFVEPMQCKPVTALPTTEGWSFELKFDGYRCIAVKEGSQVTLFSRQEKVLNARFAGVVAALTEIAGDWVLDGELVALDEEGRPAFQLLQNNLSNDQPVHLYAFDLLHRDGEDLLGLPIDERRARLSDLLGSALDPVRLAPLLQGAPDQIVEAVQKLGLEGVVGKRLGSAYEPGLRSGAWVKLRTNRTQEFVIGGYIPGAHGVDALLVGVYDGRRLNFVAKVKNGFTPRTREEVSSKVKKLAQAACPFANLPEKKAHRWGESLTAEKMNECRWVKPRLTAEIAFVEWTAAGHLRHCSFVGMSDKKTKEIRRPT